MKLEDAKAAARRAAAETGKSHVVYRFAAWPANVWGAIARDAEDLAPSAEIAAEYTPSGAEILTSELPPAQGGLF